MTTTQSSRAAALLKRRRARRRLQPRRAAAQPGARRSPTAALAKPSPPTRSTASSRSTRDGAVTIYSGKVDLGTGVRTALTQIAAEELDLPLDHVTIVQGDTALTPDQGPTYGSLSIQNGGMQIRQAAATAREALSAQAAERLGVAPGARSVAEDGAVRPKAGGAGILRGPDRRRALRDQARSRKSPTKDPSDLHDRRQSGAARSTFPTRSPAASPTCRTSGVPGMLHGRVVRPPAIGAKLESVDEGSIAGFLALIKVVREGNFLARRGASANGRRSGARASSRHTGRTGRACPNRSSSGSTCAPPRSRKDEVTSNVGDAPRRLARAPAKTLSASYDFAIHTHGSIGPSCAVAEFKDGKLTSGPRRR